MAKTATKKSTGKKSTNARGKGQASKARKAAPAPLPEGVELRDGVPHRKVIVGGRPRWVPVAD